MASDKKERLEIASVIIIIIAVSVAGFLYFWYRTHRVVRIQRQPELTKEQLLERLNQPVANPNPVISQKIIKSLSAPAKVKK